MTNLANLVRIVNGKMLNRPSVSAVESFSICAHKIHKKAAFIAVNASAKDVETAIANGAYAVIFDSDFKVSNDEVDFIKVENLNVALLRMIKFLGDIWRHQFVLIDEIQASILRFISVPKNLIFAPNTLHELFIHLISHEQKHIYFTKNREFLQLLEISYQKIEKDENLSETYSGSIFYSSFIYDEIYYTNKFDVTNSNAFRRYTTIPNKKLTARFWQMGERLRRVKIDNYLENELLEAETTEFELGEPTNDEIAYLRVLYNHLEKYIE